MINLHKHNQKSPQEGEAIAKYIAEKTITNYAQLTFILAMRILN